MYGKVPESIQPKAPFSKTSCILADLLFSRVGKFEGPMLLLYCHSTEPDASATWLRSFVGVRSSEVKSRS